MVMYMGNYFFKEEDNDNDVYTLQDEEDEQKVIDDYFDTETNNKNFWYWGYIHDLIEDKNLDPKK